MRASPACSSCAAATAAFASSRSTCRSSRAEDPSRPRAAPARSLTALALALLGGLILNLMPCVLPVLALKVFGARRARRAQPRARSRRTRFGYVAGIEVTLLALAAVVIALRAAGTYVGWGFQFQEPRFALAISLRPGRASR